MHSDSAVSSFSHPHSSYHGDAYAHAHAHYSCGCDSLLALNYRHPRPCGWSPHPCLSLSRIQRTSWSRTRTHRLIRQRLWVGGRCSRLVLVSHVQTRVGAITKARTRELRQKCAHPLTSSVPDPRCPPHPLAIAQISR